MLLAEIERVPRIWIDGTDPGRPEALVTVTPAARPRSISAADEAGKIFMSFVLTEVIEVARSLFFMVPYPTTTSWSSISDSDSM